MSFEAYYKQAEYHYQNRDYIKALELFKQSQNEKETYDCLNYIGCCYLKLEDYNSAIEVFDKIIKAFPDWERPVFNLGRVYLQIGRLEEALECFEKAIDINQNNEDSYYYLGVYYYKVGDYKAAKQCYEKSIEINDVQPETHLNLGMCYFKLKLFEKAICEFELAYKYDNDCLNAIYNKGLALISLNKYREALGNLMYVSNLNSNDIEVMLDIAHCYYKTKDLENANIWVNKVLTIEPNHILANKLLKKLLSLKQ